jgi:hypothetical protein
MESELSDVTGNQRSPIEMSHLRVSGIAGPATCSGSASY